MERPVHPCPGASCQAGTGPEAEHPRRPNLLSSRPDEQQRRWLAAPEAQRLGYGGFDVVAAVTGLHPETTRRGRDERAAEPAGRPAGHVRLPGGGPTRCPQRDPQLVGDWIKLVEPQTAGDPVPGDRRARPSLRGRSAGLSRRARATTIGRLLGANGYGLRGPRKTLTRQTHADRDTRSGSIAEQRRAFAGGHNPRISTGAEKRELAGRFRNPGRRGCRSAVAVDARDFPTAAVAHAIPYGAFDPELSRGHVCVGPSGNTADLAVDAVRGGWRQKGERRYPGASALLIEADGYSGPRN
jgi:hypothetical protein